MIGVLAPQIRRLFFQVIRIINDRIRIISYDGIIAPVEYNKCKHKNKHYQKKIHTNTKVIVLNELNQNDWKGSRIYISHRSCVHVSSQRQKG